MLASQYIGEEVEEVEEEVDGWRRWYKKEMKDGGINIINPD